MNRSALLLLAVLGCATVTPPAATAQESVVLTDMSLTRLDGTKLPAEALAGKAVVFVNVASACGYTKQYTGLQALYEARKDDGVVVVGVPCNQFGGQESGSPEEIATFCKKNFGVTFPLLEKQDVNGSKRSSLYTSLVGSGGDIKWNFEKIVVGADGAVVGRFPSSVKPDSAKLKEAIDTALAAGT
jgi:glutathione peroxidase